MKFIELKKSLAGGIKPCYIITGDDAFVRKSAVGIFRARLDKSLLDLNFVPLGKDASAGDVVSALLTPPIMSDLRVVTLTDYAADLGDVAKYLASPAPGSTLLVVSASMTPNLKKIVALSEVVDCNRLDAGYLAQWAIRRAAAYGRTMTADAANALVTRLGRDMTRIVVELEKLVDYCDEKIDVAAVDEQVVADPEFRIFELSSAIAEKNRAKALAYTDALVADGNQPTALIGMLYNHFRRMLFAALNPDSDTLAAQLKVKEYAITVALRQARGFRLVRLKELFDKLCFYDAAIKAGEMSDRNALYTFVCETVAG